MYQRWSTRFGKRSDAVVSVLRLVIAVGALLGLAPAAGVLVG